MGNVFHLLWETSSWDTEGNLFAKVKKEQLCVGSPSLAVMLVLLNLLVPFSVE